MGPLTERSARESPAGTGWPVGPLTERSARESPAGTGSRMGSRLMTSHVPKGLQHARGTPSNAHDSALHRTYAGAMRKPTGNPATPSRNHTDSSPEDPMQKPPMRRSALAK